MKSLIILILLALMPNMGDNAETRFNNISMETEQVIVVDENVAYFNLVFQGSWDSNDSVQSTANPDFTEAASETIPTESIENQIKNDSVENNEGSTKETIATQPTTPTQSITDNNKNNENPSESQAPKTEPTTSQTTKPSDVVEEAHPTMPPVVETTPTVPPTTEPETTEPAPTEPKQCTSHNMQFSYTTTDAQYQLYNYVTDYYTCANCTYAESESHIATNGISASGIAQAETELYKALNHLRTSNGLSKLWRNDYWDNWAATRAKELAIKYGHSRPNGGSWTNSDGTYYTVGENVASGNSSGYDFYLAFVNSGSHYGTMTIDSAVGVGIGIYVDDQGRTYCAMVLVAPF